MRSRQELSDDNDENGQKVLHYRHDLKVAMARRQHQSTVKVEYYKDQAKRTARMMIQQRKKTVETEMRPVASN